MKTLSPIKENGRLMQMQRLAVKLYTAAEEQYAKQRARKEHAEELIRRMHVVRGVVQESGLKHFVIATVVGVHSGFFSQMLNGERAIPDGMVERIRQAVELLQSGEA